MYICPPSPARALSFAVTGKKQRVAKGDQGAVGRAEYRNTRRRKKGVGPFRIRDECAKETNHSRDERIDRGFNRWNIVGMNERAFCVCLCPCVR